MPTKDTIARPHNPSTPFSAQQAPPSGRPPHAPTAARTPGRPPAALGRTRPSPPYHPASRREFPEPAGSERGAPGSGKWQHRCACVCVCVSMCVCVSQFVCPRVHGWGHSGGAAGGRWFRCIQTLQPPQACAHSHHSTIHITTHDHWHHAHSHTYTHTIHTHTIYTHTIHITIYRTLPLTPHTHHIHFH